LLVASLAVGCDSDGGPSPRAESLARAELLPKPIPTATAGPDSTASIIHILSSTAEANFPESLTFHVEAESSHTITGIELRYRVRKITTVAVITTISPDFAPGNKVETSWTWDTRKSSLPTGAEIEYKWVIGNSAGDRSETDWATFTFEDSHHQWRELAEGDIRLFWYDGGDSFGRALMQAGQTALVKLAQDTGAGLESTAKIYIYGNTSELHESLIFPQEWTGGLTFAEYGIIVIGVSTNEQDWGEKTVAHELTHLVIHQMVSGPLSVLPTWLDEGLAMSSERELRGDLQRMLENAIASDTLHSVRSLTGSFPADYDEAGLAYAQSYSLVRFLVDSYGGEKMLALLRVFKAGSSPDDALMEVYGFDLAGFEELWRESLGLEATAMAVTIAILD